MLHRLLLLHTMPLICFESSLCLTGGLSSSLGPPALPQSSLHSLMCGLSKGDLAAPTPAAFTLVFGGLLLESCGFGEFWLLLNSFLPHIPAQVWYLCTNPVQGLRYSPGSHISHSSLHFPPWGLFPMAPRPSDMFFEEQRSPSRAGAVMLSCLSLSDPHCSG